MTAAVDAAAEVCDLYLRGGSPTTHDKPTAIAMLTRGDPGVQDVAALDRDDAPVDHVQVCAPAARQHGEKRGAVVDSG